MSECIGEGCTAPGCSGRNAAAVNAIAATDGPTSAASLQAYLSGAVRRVGAAQPQGNRAQRRAARRKGTRG